ncbi:MAG: DUF2924 domain-containing protein [Rhodospirillaceae bacterium]|jgi:hypothetical protein|nr:DUF2924 domain-containing protein [Rhodospirillaceae bacterium]
METRLPHPDKLRDLELAIQATAHLDRPECLDRWQRAFGHPPPKYISIGFMRRVLIWKLQCETLGGLSKSTERALRRIANGNSTSASAKPGSRLVREWNGRTYQIEVTDDGFIMDGTIYKSLSSVARQITGARWSGPRFFWIG